MADKDKTNNYWDGKNRFYILTKFDEDLRDNIIQPLTKKIFELKKQKESEIEIWINSRGGDAATCMHIVRLVELAKANDITVKTIVVDRAYSAGSIVAVAGTPGHRYIADRAEHLFHYGHHSGWSESTPLQTDRNAKHKKRWFEQVLDHYEKYTKVPDLKSKIDDDSYFLTTAQCLRWKVADKKLEDL